MTRDARLSALHRGDFRPGAALPSPALPPDPCSELLAARSSCLAGGVPDLPSPRLRAAAAGRHSPLRLSGSSPETPLMSEDTNRRILQTRYVVNNYLRVVAGKEDRMVEPDDDEACERDGIGNDVAAGHAPPRRHRSRQSMNLSRCDCS